MPASFSDEQWAVILQIARAALDLPKTDRCGFIQDSTEDPAIASEAIKLAEELEQPEQDEPRRTNTAVGRFLLLDFLGSGGAGEVYSARDPELRRLVAIKILKPETYRLRDPEQRFLREARAASALNHPNIVTVHEIVRTEENLAIVMELVGGESLRAKCGTPIAPREVIRIGQQIVAGLAAAHEAGVVHRDIKPENVMVMPSGHVKVLDFGLAQSAAFGTLTNATAREGLRAGTPRYMSPEHIQGQPLTPASDIFASGVVLYEMTTGRHPFQRDAPLELLHAIAHEEPSPPSLLNPVVPPRLESLIAAMMRKYPEARPTATNVVRELERVDEPAQVADYMPGRRGTWWRKWAIAGLALGAAAVVTIAWRVSRSPASIGELEQVTSLVPDNHATAAAISGNGRFLAYANVDGVFVRTLGSAEAAKLNGPSNFAVDQLAWLSDDAGLIASGFLGNTNRTAIWSLPLAGGAARELRRGGRLASPSPDGSRIAFLQDDYSAIWTMAADGGEQRKLIQNPNDIFVLVLWSSEGRHLIFQRRKHAGPPESAFVLSDSHYRPVLESASAETGGMSDQLQDFVVTTAASVSTGELLFLGGTKPGSAGTHRIWSTSIDPRSGNFSRHYKTWETGISELDPALDLSATRNDSAIALIRSRIRESIFVADFAESPPRVENARELTIDSKASYPHAWTADSRSVIFESDRSGGYDLYLQRLGDRLPTPIVNSSKRWEVLPQLAPGGELILYAAGPPEGGSSSYTLMRVPVQGGTPAEVPGGRALEEFRCSVGGKGRCVIKKTVGRTSFVYLNVDPVSGVGRELARSSWLPYVLADWDVSPDGKQLAIPNHDLRSALIRIVSLEEVAAGARERELSLPDLTNLSNVVWSPDGNGWFVSVGSLGSTYLGGRLYFCGLDGQLTLLGPINGWAVPAPDKKKIAYLDRIYDANVWMVRRSK